MGDVPTVVVAPKLAAAALGGDRGDPAGASGLGSRHCQAGIIARRGKEARNIAKVAAARRLLTLVFYGLRDGQIRCLPRSPAGPPPAQPPARTA